MEKIEENYCFQTLSYSFFKFSDLKTNVFEKIAQAYIFTYNKNMTTITVTNARKNLFNLVNQANSSHDPVHITGKSGNAVLVSESDWESIQETLFLVSIPGMRESIRDGLNANVTDCTDNLDW